jgi:hypothetical protein
LALNLCEPLLNSFKRIVFQALAYLPLLKHKSVLISFMQKPLLAYLTDSRLP